MFSELWVQYSIRTFVDVPSLGAVSAGDRDFLPSTVLELIFFHVLLFTVSHVQHFMLLVL